MKNDYGFSLDKCNYTERSSRLDSIYTYPPSNSVLAIIKTIPNGLEKVIELQNKIKEKEENGN